jgi:hypothetical protein
MGRRSAYGDEGGGVGLVLVLGAGIGFLPWCSSSGEKESDSEMGDRP